MLFITNCETDEAYPIGVSVDGGWEISPFFKQDDFAHWLKAQGPVDLEMMFAQESIEQVTLNCPSCGEAVIAIADNTDPDRDIMNFECKNCGKSDSIEIVEPDEGQE